MPALYRRDRTACVYFLRQRDGDRCRYCLVLLDDDNVTVEHLQPSSRGGTNKLENLALSCDTCNNEKGELTDDEFFQYLAGEYTSDCVYCGSSIHPFKRYCKNHGKRFGTLRKATPIYAQLVLDASPELKQDLYLALRRS